MKHEPNETTRFRSWRTLDGRAESVGVVRRNKRPVPSFAPTAAETPSRIHPNLKPLLRELMYGLTKTERRTWLLLLLGYSIVETARKENVSRSAIYERIRGNSKGQGGMIRKNDYVWIWWRDQRNNNTQDHE